MSWSKKILCERWAWARPLLREYVVRRVGYLGVEPLFAEARREAQAGWAWNGTTTTTYWVMDEMSRMLFEHGEFDLAGDDQCLIMEYVV